MIILIPDANDSIIYIQLIVIYNSTAHISVSIWLFYWSWKYAWIKTFSLTFPWSSNKYPFPDLPDPVETLSLLVGGNSKVTNQDLKFFMNLPGNYTSFIGATHNSICSWKNVMTFYFYPYPPFENVMKIFMKMFCLI